MNSSFLGIGTNLGDRCENIHTCLSLIERFACVKSISSTLENPALLPENAPPEWNVPFLNLAVEIKTNLSIFQTFTAIKHIEHSMGRVESCERWSPRVIDIDILTYNSLIILNDVIAVPHPQMEFRRFVLEPICEINPNGIHPVHRKSYRQLLAELDLHQ